jgi:hypothetical protein
MNSLAGGSSNTNPMPCHGRPLTSLSRVFQKLTYHQDLHLLNLPTNPQSNHTPIYHPCPVSTALTRHEPTPLPQSNDDRQEKTRNKNYQHNDIPGFQATTNPLPGAMTIRIYMPNPSCTLQNSMHSPRVHRQPVYPLRNKSPAPLRTALVRSGWSMPRQSSVSVMSQRTSSEAGGWG